MIGAAILQVGAIGMKVFGAVKTYNALKDQAQKDKFNMNRQQDLLRDLENSRQTLTNPYANLGVATQAAEMEIEQADIALANTLDTIRATGGAAGGATALAQAALQSKKGVAASIEKQEANNQQMQARGKERMLIMQEDRENMGLDRQAALADQAANQSRASDTNQILAQQALFDLGGDALQAGAYAASLGGGTQTNPYDGSATVGGVGDSSTGFGSGNISKGFGGQG